MAMAPQASSRPSDAAAATGPCRVMVVDDSAVVRGLITRILQGYSDISVVKSVANGEAAIRAAETTPLDIILLDVEMPVMDGMTALPKLLEVAPRAKVIMNSTLTRRNAAITLRALSHGAADFIAKPTASRDLNAATAFGEELIGKIRALSNAGVARAETAVEPSGTGTGTEKKSLYAGATVRLRNTPLPTPDLLAIGSSTGGPQALLKFFGGFARMPAVPIVITQHMPATFTAILAEHLTRATATGCAEGAQGEALKSGKIYIAPGGHHMQLVKADTLAPVSIAIDDGPPENFCKPSVDPMLRSAIKVYGGRIWVVILTGMGQDGLKGCEAVTAAGGAVFAQDEASSVVWGMPGAVATHGLCHGVWPLDQLGAKVSAMLAEKGR